MVGRAVVYFVVHSLGYHPVFRPENIGDLFSYTHYNLTMPLAVHSREHNAQMYSSRSFFTAVITFLDLLF